MKTIRTYEHYKKAWRAYTLMCIWHFVSGLITGIIATLAVMYG
jgi:hypothetical protein